MGEKLTKVEQRWRWLANRAWSGTYMGWTPDFRFETKGDKAILERRIKGGQVERDDCMVRLTDLGRAALAKEQRE